MSAPDTDLEKQKKRHWGPLVIMFAGLALAAIFGFGVLFTTAPEQGDGEADIVPSPEVVAPAAD
jgi:hypothetical protein